MVFAFACIQSLSLQVCTHVVGVCVHVRERERERALMISLLDKPSTKKQETSYSLKVRHLGQFTSLLDQAQRCLRWMCSKPIIGPALDVICEVSEKHASYKK